MPRIKNKSTKPRQYKGKSRANWKDPWKLQLPGHDMFLQLHRTLREEIARRWNRGLPFNEELFDRWERARFLGFGNGSSIYDTSVVMGDVNVGTNTWIGPFTVLDGSGGLEIGSYCSISSGVHIYTHDTVKWAVSGGNAEIEHAPVKIGNCCYIGCYSVISRGITIGDHSVVGACSFVNQDIPAYTIAFGTPCRRVGHVTLDGRRTVEFEFDKRPKNLKT
jgi:acetyltransferase-like isoleucine patch superfamily enzyme